MDTLHKTAAGLTPANPREEQPPPLQGQHYHFLDVHSNVVWCTNSSRQLITPHFHSRMSMPRPTCRRPFSKPHSRRLRTNSCPLISCHHRHLNKPHPTCRHHISTVLTSCPLDLRLHHTSSKMKVPHCLSQLLTPPCALSLPPSPLTPRTLKAPHRHSHILTPPPALTLPQWALEEAGRVLTTRRRPSLSLTLPQWASEEAGRVLATRRRPFLSTQCLLFLMETLASKRKMVPHMSPRHKAHLLNHPPLP